jgi:LacI family transcriptional regulator
MEHLIGSGFRRIAHATFMQESSLSDPRSLVYFEAMKQAGLRPEFIYYPLSESQRSIIRQLIQSYIRQRGHPEAIFCHSDDATVAIYRGLCDIGLRVPEDVALVGCDGIPDTEYLECPLTTIVQPISQMCSTAWQFLMNRLNHPDTALQHLELKPSLVIRRSSERVASAV